MNDKDLADLRSWCRDCAEHVDTPEGEEAVVMLWAEYTGHADIHALIHAGRYADARARLGALPI